MAPRPLNVSVNSLTECIACTRANREISFNRVIIVTIESRPLLVKRSSSTTHPGCATVSLPTATVHHCSLCDCATLGLRYVAMQSI